MLNDKRLNNNNELRSALLDTLILKIPIARKLILPWDIQEELINLIHMTAQAQSRILNTKGLPHIEINFKN